MTADRAECSITLVVNLDFLSSCNKRRRCTEVAWDVITKQQRPAHTGELVKTVVNYTIDFNHIQKANAEKAFAQTLHSVVVILWEVIFCMKQDQIEQVASIMNTFKDPPLAASEMLANNHQNHDSHCGTDVARARWALLRQVRGV